MFEKMKPLGDRVLVKRIEHESKTPGGLYIPDAAKEKGQEGIVVAVGPGRITSEGKAIPMTVPIGACVLFGKYSGTEVKLGYDDYLIIREEEILGIVEK
jgi:chaperonin GroES